MSRLIKIHESVEATIVTPNLTGFQESAKTDGKLPDKIVTVVEAIHSGLTRNNTFYPSDNLKESVDTWTAPYNKPVIKNHDVYEEPLGRVKSATFKQSNLSPDKQTIELELEIIDQDAIQKVMDGRYHTLSIGGSTNSVTCSICGKDIVKEGWCGHMKGRTYEGKKAYWIIGEMDFDEISWVNVPADTSAQVVHKDVSKPTESTSTTEGGVSEMDEQTKDILDQIDQLTGISESTSDGETTSETSEGTTTTQEGQETTSDSTSTEDSDATQTTESTDGEGEEATDNDAPEVTKEALDEANSRISVLEADNTTLTAAKDDLQTKLDTSLSENKTLQDRVKELEEELSVAEQENKDLIEQRVTLATYAHKVLAESVATIQVVLGKINESDLQSKISELSKLTSHSLKEHMSELAKEKPQRIVQTIEHPSTNGGSEGDVAESTSQKTKELTLVDYADKITAAINRQFN